MGTLAVSLGARLSFLPHLQKGHVDASVRDLSDNLAEDLALRPKLRNKVISQTLDRNGCMFGLFEESSHDPW